ncbi:MULTISPECIES: CHASE2 domain-containing protein [unclassified Prochlorococcus]|uniref:CHASE2 domain-containing protein n=1 Tax=unclassified Prochlorococcus TaxID=2627481 RepID=UPI000533718C|nr:MULTISPECIES: CHASE2 domain-containing protein [unclassified Prochlorococcus]KGG25295.1 Adenylate cyclase [Prochlorococcus sp. MIT 0701]KGG26327.1 Adenylate cyclase [Prochlorococcus sp. MIT 0702]KGG31257.1 Adenylate cyclase [Prochlorococcus sp. MIT 0703]
MGKASKSSGHQRQQPRPTKATGWRSITARGIAWRIAPYLIGLALLAVFKGFGISQGLDLLLYDLVTTLRPAASGKTQPITIIGIGEDDIRNHGFPIDDGLFCKGIDQLSKNGAVAIGFDIYRDQGVGPNQECLRERFRNNPRLVSIFNVASNIPAVPGTPPERHSYNDVSVDDDNVIRRDLVHVAGQDEATVAFPLRIVEVGTKDKKLRQQLEAGTITDAWLTANPNGNFLFHGSHAGGYFNQKAARDGMQRLIVFREPGSFRTFSLSALLNGDVPKAAIANHMVLIGSTAPSLKDLFEIPHSRFSEGEIQLKMPGIEVHALRVAALLDRQQGILVRGFLMPGWGNMMLILATAGLGLWLGESFSTLRRSVIVVVTAAVVLSAGLVLLLINYIWIGTVMPVAGLTVLAGTAWIRRGAASQKHQQEIQRLLGQATSPAVAQQLWQQRDQLLKDGRFEGRQLPVTVLFTDTANFTTVSEHFQPAELMDWLNRGMASCVPAVTTRGGMINKFTGDGLLAVFGVPLSEDPKADARAAIEAVIEIQTGLVKLNEELAKEGAPANRMRIGIHSGVVLAGSMGSSERLEYAIIGDTVNCASRLESFEKNRHVGVLRVLVSSTTRELLGDELNNSLHWDEWGEIQVKGREEPLLVSELTMDNAPATGPASSK